MPPQIASATRDPFNGKTDLDEPTRPVRSQSSSQANIHEPRSARLDSEFILPWSVPTVEELMNERKNRYTDDEKKEAWHKAINTVKIYSNEMIARWNSEIDALLVYAGLFSAVLTAFNVQSYPLLNPLPPDPIISALHQISSQLSSFSLTPSFVNSTHPPFEPRASAATSPAPPRSAVILNILWFSSLILSLSAASIGILVKQWLNEYKSGLSGDSREIARLRQHRLKSLERWHVAEIVAVLPIFLQLALALFFAGLLVLLWTLHEAVAGVATVLVSALFVFVIATTVLPAVKDGCCYLSPQSFAVIVLSHNTRMLFQYLRHFLIRRFFKCAESYNHLLGQAMTPRGREQSLVQRMRHVLDMEMISTAYEISMDWNFLRDVAVCFVDFRCENIMRCFWAIHSANVKHYGADFTPRRGDVPVVFSSDLILVWIAYCSSFRGPKLGNGDAFFRERFGIGATTACLKTYLKALNYTDLSKFNPAAQILYQLMFESDALPFHDTLVNKLEYCLLTASNGVSIHRLTPAAERFLRSSIQQPDARKQCLVTLRILLRCVGAAARLPPTDFPPEDMGTLLTCVRSTLSDWADSLSMPVWLDIDDRSFHELDRVLLWLEVVARQHDVVPKHLVDRLAHLLKGAWKKNGRDMDVVQGELDDLRKVLTDNAVSV